MYRLAFQTFRRNYPLLICLCLVSAILQWTVPVLGVALLFLLPPIVLHWTLRMVLLGETYGWTSFLTDGLEIPMRQHIAYWLRFLGIYVVSFVAVMIVATAMILTFTLTGDGRLPMNDGVLGALTLWPGFALALTLLGPSLAETATGGKSRLRKTLRIARMTFGRTLLNLMLGPFLLFLLISILPFYFDPEGAFGGHGAKVYASANWSIWVVASFLTGIAIAMAYQSATKRMEHDAVVAVF